MNDAEKPLSSRDKSRMMKVNKDKQRLKRLDVARSFRVASTIKHATKTTPTPVNTGDFDALFDSIKQANTKRAATAPRARPTPAKGIMATITASRTSSITQSSIKTKKAAVRRRSIIPDEVTSPDFVRVRADAARRGMECRASQAALILEDATLSLSCSQSAGCSSQSQPSLQDRVDSLSGSSFALPSKDKQWNTMETVSNVARQLCGGIKPKVAV